MTPIFEKEYEKHYKQAAANLIAQTKSQILKQKDRLVLAGENEDDCIDKMKKKVNTLAEALTRKDKFLKIVPSAEVEELKNELDPILRECYRDEMAKRVEDLINHTQRKILDEKNKIVSKSEDEEDCLTKMADR
eukprot:UN34629